MVGPGVAIEPDPGETTVVSPIAGKVVKVHPHAFVVLGADGVGVLVHLGINTVRLEGKGFEVLVDPGRDRRRRRPDGALGPGHRSRGDGHLARSSRSWRWTARRARSPAPAAGAVAATGDLLFTVDPVTPAALLLDLDGTLVDSEPLHRAAYRAFFEARGWDVPDLSLFTGRRAEDVFAAEPGPWAGPRPRRAGRRGDRPRRRRAARPTRCPARRTLIEAAHRHGVPVAVVTSAGPAWTHPRHRRPAGLAADRIDLVVTADDVVDGKPDPTGYRLACERLGVDPADALAVEDSPAGVRAAVAAGVGEVIGVSTTHRPAELTDAGAVRSCRTSPPWPSAWGLNE